MVFNKSYVSFQTANFPPLFCSYLNNDEGLLSLHAGPPTLGNIQKQCSSISFDANSREKLVTVLNDQYRNIGEEKESKVLKHQINSLLKPNTFTVTTGHQLCLFTGPLYFIYKIISCVKLAKTLNEKYPAQHFVPVYWMATEDHDFDEVNHLNLFGKQYVWQYEPAKDTVVGAVSTDKIDELLEVLKSDLGSGFDTSGLHQLLQETYLTHNNLADATRHFVHRLFGKHGLVILDARDERLKEGFSDIVLEELKDSVAMTCLERSSELLQKQGYKLQINPREVNLFYIKDDIRKRIDKAKGAFVLADEGESFSEEELYGLLKKSPDEFSPNVVLRPVYQQLLLPNCAYIGGPAEIAYWLQLKPLCDHLKVTFPVLVPRLSAVLLGSQSVQTLEKLQLNDKDLFTGLHQLESSLIHENSDIKDKIESSKGVLKKELGQLANYSSKIDGSFAGFIISQEKQIEKFIEALEKKLVRAEKQKYDVMLKKLRKLKAEIEPEGVLQERHESFVGLVMKYGLAIVDELLELHEPLECNLMLLKEREK